MKDTPLDNISDNSSENVENRIAVDLKEAMITKDALRVSVLRSLKSAFTYAKVAARPASDSQNSALSEDDLLVLMAKEAKKRQEAADSYLVAGQPDRSAIELAEKAMIDGYLPAKPSEEAINLMVENAVLQIETQLRAQSEQISFKAMGQVISIVKAKAGPMADGSLIAKLVKEKLKT